MATDETYDLIIVGGGPGGLTAGIYAMRAALKTVLIEKSAYGGQISLSGEVENYPGFEHISGYELCEKLQKHAESYGIEMIQAEATAIDPGLDFHSVRLEDGRTLQSHAIILASGGNPRKLSIPGENEYYGKGVSYCAVCDGFFFRNKTVAVIGGGDSACEEGLYLAKLAKKVYLVHRRDALRASRILQQRVQNDCNIEILWNKIPVQVEGGDAGLRAIRLKDTQTGETSELAVDGMFVFVGFSPNNALVPTGVRMTPEGHVITDEKCETAIPGLFVVGDLRQKYARQIVIAAGEGCTAALAAAHFVENKKARLADSCELPE
jgi:thioredoxin reductase (NADPH)